MRRIVLFTLSAAVMFQMGAVSIARAEDDHDRRNLRLDCRFEEAFGEVGKGPKGPVGGIGREHRCRVHARTFEGRGDEDDTLFAIATDAPAPAPAVHDDEDNRDRRRSRMRVECDGRDIYEDGAFRTRFDGYEFLQARDRDIVLKFPRFHREDGDHDEGHRLHASWLKLDGFVLEGWCSIEREHRDHE